MVRDTSLAAYRELKNSLGARQHQVLRVLIKKDCTNRELCKELDLPINSITGRVSELERKGLIEAKAKIKDPVTGRKVYKWGIRE